MKVMNKILSVFLAFLMIFSANIVSFAEDEIPTNPDSGGTDIETPVNPDENNTIKILLIYNEEDESKNESVEITQSELNGAELADYVNEKYAKADEYNAAEISGEHNKITFCWELQNSTPTPAEGDGVEQSADPITENADDSTAEPNEGEGDTNPEPAPEPNPDYDYTFVLKSEQTKEVCAPKFIDTEADCEKPKIRQLICEYCKQTFGEPIKLGEPLKHDWKDGVCQRENCGKECKHVNKEIIDESEKVATCTEGGYTGDQKCEDCDVVVKGETTDALGHDYVETVTPPTCIAAGVKTYKCSRCGDEYTDAGDPMTGHTPATEAVKEDVVDSTCDKEGSYNEVVRCTVCNSIISSEAKTIEKKAHTPNDAVKENVIDATCTSEGSYDEVVYCSVCQAEISRTSKKLNKTNHTYKDGECTVCHLADTYNNKYKDVSCKTVYFVGEKWNSDIKLTLVFEHSEKKVTVKSKDINNLKGFSTAKPNNNMKCTFSYTYSGKTVTVNLPAIKCLPPQIVLEKTKGNDSVNLFEDFSKSTTASRSLYIRNAGLKFTYQILLQNCKIKLSPEAEKVCELQNTYQKQTWKGRPAEKLVKTLNVTNAKEIGVKGSGAEGVLLIKPKKYFDASKKASDYYVTISGTANGKTYKLKIYLFGVTSIKPSTKSVTITNGTSSKKSVKFKESYADKTAVYYTKKLTLNAKTVGRQSVACTINGNKAAYYYYVKCKAPSVKVSSAKKAVNLSWKKVSGATGYKIYRSTNKNKGYKCVKTIKNGKTVKYKDTKLKSKKKYYYKVVAVYSKNTKCNSSYSAIKSCKTK